MEHVPLALAVSGGVLVLAAAVGWLAQSGAGAAGAAAGVALVVVSYLVSSVVVAWADSISPQLVLPVGLGTYITKFVLLGLVMLAVVQTGWDGTTAMGLAIIPGVVGWTGANVWWALRRPPGATQHTPTGSGQATGYQE
jgi:phosphotransferase system  glucose/maltose/N-acetylglucosamine-specific IIC component